MSLPPLSGISEYESWTATMTSSYYTASISMTTISSSLWGAFYTHSGTNVVLQHVTASSGNHFFESTADLGGRISVFFIPIKRVIE